MILHFSPAGFTHRPALCLAGANPRSAKSVRKACCASAPPAPQSRAGRSQTRGLLPSGSIGALLTAVRIAPFRQPPSPRFIPPSGSIVALLTAVRIAPFRQPPSPRFIPPSGSIGALLTAARTACFASLLRLALSLHLAQSAHCSLPFALLRFASLLRLALSLHLAQSAHCSLPLALLVSPASSTPPSSATGGVGVPEPQAALRLRSPRCSPRLFAPRGFMDNFFIS